MLPVFEIEGPSNDAFPTLDVCLPQVPLPSGVSVAEGDLGTIQVVEAAKHGAALFSVSCCGFLLPVLLHFARLSADVFLFCGLFLSGMERLCCLYFSSKGCNDRATD